MLFIGNFLWQTIYNAYFMLVFTRNSSYCCSAS